MHLNFKRNANHGPERKSKKKNPLKNTRLEIVGRITSLDIDRSRIEIADERDDRMLWLDLSKTKFRNLSDANGDGHYSISDLFPGDRVRVQCKQQIKELHAKTLYRLGATAPNGGLRKVFG